MLKIRTATIEKRTENERLAIQVEKQTLELKKAHAIISALLETLKQEKEYFERMFNTSPDAALVTHLSDGRIVDVNEGFIRLSGYTRKEAIGNNSQDMNLYSNMEDRDRILGELYEKGIATVWKRFSGAKTGIC